MKIVEEEKEDRISLLPDCLILEILTRLRSTKYAVRTGILSKRWIHLWTFLPKHLFITSSNEKQTLADFVSFADKVLSQFTCQLNLKKFEVYTFFSSQYDSKRENKISVQRNIKDVSILLWFWNWEGERIVDQTPSIIDSRITYLRLSNFKYNPTSAISWIKLKSLCITYMKLDEDLIQNILDGSPLLETLELVGCHGYRQLNITSKSITSLLFSGYLDCEFDDFKDIIEINAPNILTLTIKDLLILMEILLLDVSSLIKVNLNYTKVGYFETTYEEAEEETLKGFILTLHHVKELQIGSSCFKVLSRLKDKGFILPSNVKVSER